MSSVVSIAGSHRVRSNHGVAMSFAGQQRRPPHSFFDRAQAGHAEAAADAWDRVRRFIAAHATVKDSG